MARHKHIHLTAEDIANLNLSEIGLLLNRFGRAVVPEYNIPAVKALMKEQGMKTRNINMSCDPGHGWAKVKRRELAKLGILDKITSFSYQKGDYVYLEEDMDLSTYLIALKAQHGENLRFVFVSTHSNKQSRIRNYTPFAAL